jgi:hypothetical protein
MRISFPIQGLNEGLPSSTQPDRTAFLLRNCRAFSVENERLTGGQRPGTTKQYSTQCGLDGATAHPILFCAQVTSTFIPAVTP